MRHNKAVTFKKFSSFEKENREEHRRLAMLTPEQRLDEFAILQERVWGKDWTEKRIIKLVRIEKVTWL